MCRIKRKKYAGQQVANHLAPVVSIGHRKGICTENFIIFAAEQDS